MSKDSRDPEAIGLYLREQRRLRPNERMSEIYDTDRGRGIDIAATGNQYRAALAVGDLQNGSGTIPT